MNTPEQNSQQNAPDIEQLACAIRFALVVIVLGLSCLSIPGSLSIDNFSQLFKDMLGSHPLPILTTFILNNRLLFVAVSVLVPLVAISMLFFRGLVVSFYIIGVVGLITVIQFVALFLGLLSPLLAILAAMQSQ